MYEIIFSCVLVFFFFKQKTAYEMRISDWSSDVCSSDLLLRGRKVHARVRMLVVPGSDAVKRAAEAEGIDHIVRTAGGEWREPGCSMCKIGRASCRERVCQYV